MGRGGRNFLPGMALGRGAFILSGRDHDSMTKIERAQVQVLMERGKLRFVPAEGGHSYAWDGMEIFVPGDLSRAEEHFAAFLRREKIRVHRRVLRSHLGFLRRRLDVDE